MPEKFASDYIDVAARLRDLRVSHPEASLQPLDPAQPYRVETMPDGAVFIVYAAACFRTPDDPRPGVGLAYEAYPGRTPYTRGSELQNAETSAWGRAIVAALAGDTHKGIASAEEVRNRRAEQAAPAAQPLPPAEWLSRIRGAENLDSLRALWQHASGAGQLALACGEEGTSATVKELIDAKRKVLQGVATAEEPPPAEAAEEPPGGWPAAAAPGSGGRKAKEAKA